MLWYSFHKRRPTIKWFHQTTAKDLIFFDVKNVEEIGRASLQWDSFLPVSTHSEMWKPVCDNSSKLLLVVPTFFRGKFCQIPRASLQNSAAHCGKIVQIARFSTAAHLWLKTERAVQKLQLLNAGIVLEGQCALAVSTLVRIGLKLC